MNQIIKKAVSDLIVALQDDQVYGNYNSSYLPNVNELLKTSTGIELSDDYVKRILNKIILP